MRARRLAIALLFAAGCAERPITVDRLAIVNVNPSPGAVDIGSDTDVVITFSELLRAETANASTICLVRADAVPAADCTGTVVPAQVQYDPATFSVRLTPALGLDPAADYVIRMTRGALGDESGSLPATVESGFRTF